MLVTALKSIVHRRVEYGLKVLVRYHFQWRKTTVRWLQRATCKKRNRVRLESIVLLQNCKMKSKRIVVVLKCKKCFLLRKLTKMSHLILCFSEFHKFVFVSGRMLFYLRTEKKLSVWGSVLFTVSPLCVRGKHKENTLWLVFLTLLTNSCLKLKVETLY